MEKIKILSICGSNIIDNRGTPIRIRNIIDGLAKYNDLELYVFSLDKSLPLSVHHISISKNKWQNIFAIVRYVRDNKIDLVIGHTLTAWYYLLPVKFLTKAKIYLEMHGFIEEEALLNGNIGKFTYYKNRLIYRSIFRLCDLITTCSDTAADIIGRYKKNTISIFGGVDFKVFNPQVQSSGMVNKDGIIIGYAGNARVWQGLDFMVKVYKDLIKDHSEFKLKILTSKTNQWDNDPAIENYGPVEYQAVPKFLVDCDILVIPRQDNEVNRISFPSKLPEYMAMAKPVIASRTSDMDKIIIDGENGLLYDPGDEDKLAENLLRLKDETLRRQLGQNAYQFVKDNLNWDKQVNVIYNKIIELF